MLSQGEQNNTTRIYTHKKKQPNCLVKSKKRLTRNKAVNKSKTWGRERGEGEEKRNKKKKRGNKKNRRKKMWTPGRSQVSEKVSRALLLCYHISVL